MVEPTGEFENDPNLTDKKFPGKPNAIVSYPRAALDALPRKGTAQIED